MKLYLAGMYTNSMMKGQSKYLRMTEHEKSIIDSSPHVLESYHYVKTTRQINAMRQCGKKVFIDSGAYSAHTLGATIDLRDYCQYLHRNSDLILVDDGVSLASVLDGIGDPLQTWRNQLAMERMGVKPLPCFHFGEDEKYLEWYLQRYPYITIGGLVGKTDVQTFAWLDRIWNKYLLDGSGNPRVKTHAFGLTRMETMKRYPWYSVDSSGWIQYGAFGQLFFVEFGEMAVSSSSYTKHTKGRHITTLPEVERQAIIRVIESKGFTFEAVAESDISRAAFNCLTYREFNDMVNQHFERVSGVLDCHAIQQLF